MFIFQVFIQRWATPQDSIKNNEKLAPLDASKVEMIDYPLWAIEILEQNGLKRDENGFFTIKIATESDALKLVDWWRQQIAPWAAQNNKENHNILYCSASDGGIESDLLGLESF